MCLLQCNGAGHLEGEGSLTEDVDGKEAFTIYKAKAHSRSLRFGGYITEVVRSLFFFS